MTSRKPRWLTLIAMLVVLALSACSGGAGSSGGGITTITIEGPNQWTNSGSTFGPAWEKLIAAFEKDNPKIKVKTVVLPVAQFNETESTQLAAGTAPELVFNQATYKPYMVYHLENDLKKPDPYVPGNKAWIDLFKPDFYSLDKSVDAEGHVDWLPFNLFEAGVFYNKDALKKAGVQAPIANWEDLMSACGKLKAAGYTPFAMDDSLIGVSWTWNAIAYMLLDKYYSELNYYDPSGKPGKSPTLTREDWAKAILTKQVTADAPEVAEALKLLKQLFDSCMTKNWSGIAGTSGSMADIKDFASGQAAMAWGTDYAPAALTGVSFQYGSMPFPQITKATTPLSTNAPARWGVSTGGTSYMIPAKTTGDKLKAAISFLQWMSAAQKIQPWLDATGAIPAVKDGKISDQTLGFTKGAWAEPPKAAGIPGAPAGVAIVSLWDGYLLGSKDLAAEQEHLEDMWTKSETESIQTYGWTDQPWAKPRS